VELAFIVDPLDSLKAYKDTSVSMMRAAQARGHTLFALEQSDVFWEDGATCARVRSLSVTSDDHDWCSAGEALVRPLSSFSAVLMRKGKQLHHDAAGAPLALIGQERLEGQREGSALGVTSPASVAYQVALVRASDQAILGTDRFDYTQQSLSENLLDLPRFLKAGGRWMTREEILQGALEETAHKLATALGIRMTYFFETI